MRAEKLANQAPVKMLFPLIALLFPVTFIIIGFPIVIQLVEAGAMDLLRIWCSQRHTLTSFFTEDGICVASRVRTATTAARSLAC